MKLCFPVESNEGVESKVYNHFGSAPCFVVFDTATRAVSFIDNKDLHHEHGACNPTKALDNNKVNAVVVGGIGAGALNKLNQSGIRVFQSSATSIRDNVALFASGALPEYSLNQCCAGGHGDDHSCAH